MIAPTRAPEADDHDITHLLLAWRQGEGDALEPLIDRVYRQLKGLAATMLRAESHKERFDTTELVHEAFVRLIDIERVEWRDRNHFLPSARG